MKMGEKSITDPTKMGVFARHIESGDLEAARNILLDTKERGRVAKSVDAAAQAEGSLLGDDDLAAFDTRAAASELTHRFGEMERLVSSLEARLARLERRPQSASPAPVQTETTVAKAVGSKKRRMTPAEEKANLLHKIDAYVSSPTRVGVLTSKLEAGELDEVRQAVAEAERSHGAVRLIVFSTSASPGRISVLPTSIPAMVRRASTSGFIPLFPSSP